MKIGIEAQRLFRPDKHGMEIVTQELIRALQVLDKKNEYALFIKPDMDQVISETDNFSISYITGSYPVWEQIKLPRALKKEKVDFLHCTSNTGPLCSAVPMLLTLHDIIYLEQIEFKGSAYQNFGNLYRRLVVPGLLKRCKYILTVSEFEKNSISARLNIPDECLHVVYNGVSPTFRLISDKLALAACRLKHGLPPDFYLFFGNTAPKKNTERLLLGYAEAALENPLLPWLVITDYDELLISRILVETRYKKIRSRILTLGHFPHEEMPLLYNLARIFLYPSLRESFGMPILEAMACGTPVITSSSSSMPEVAGGAAELVNPFDTAEITTAILLLESSSAIYSRRVAEGIKRSQDFSWENTARAVLSFYDKMSS